MVMSHTNKGFILLDALLAVFILTYICLICFSIFKSIDTYNSSYMKYQENSNEHYERIFNSIPICEPCIIDESD